MPMQKLEPRQSLVLVVDVQERLVAAMPAEAGAKAVARTALLVRGASALGVPVIVTEQYPKGLGPTVAAVGEALCELSSPAPRLPKLDFDVSRDPAILAAILATGATQVVVAGMESHICVHQSARGLTSAGFQVHVALDATCSRDALHTDLARGLWRDDGALVSAVETVLFDWLGRAGGDAFKRVSSLLR